MADHVHDDRCSHPSQEVVLHGCKVAIQKYGWYCTGVFGDEEGPPFSYTTGLLQNVLKAGGEYDRVASGFPVRVLAAGPAGWSTWHGASRAWYGFDPERLQMVWPDADGHFPGDPDCVPRVAEAQEIGGAS